MHWELIKKCNLVVKDNFYTWSQSRKFFTERGLEVILNFTIKTHQVIEARRLDLVVVDKKNRTCKIIDFGDGENKTEKEKN